MTADLYGFELPAGWIIERPEYLQDCIIIGSPSKGWVTVDMKNRIFGTGYGRPRTLRPSMTFKGGNWRFRLLTAAADHLISIEEEVTK